MAMLPQLTESTLDLICRTLADAVSHKEVAILLSQSGLVERGGTPKWERMLLALVHRQKEDRCGNNALNFLCAVLHPSRFAGKHESFETFRTSVNFQLAFYGLAIDEKGQPKPVAAAATIPEATARANELRAELAQRRVHPDVLRFCKSELLQDNFFHCVLEAAKSVFQKIRDLTGIQKDGAALAEEAFSVTKPRLAINTLRTESEQSEQKGFANLLKACSVRSGT